MRFTAAISFYNIFLVGVSPNRHLPAIPQRTQYNKLVFRRASSDKRLLSTFFSFSNANSFSFMFFHVQSHRFFVAFPGEFILDICIFIFITFYYNYGLCMCVYIVLKQPILLKIWKLRTLARRGGIPRPRAMTFNPFYMFAIIHPIDTSLFGSYFRLFSVITKVIVDEVSTITTSINVSYFLQSRTSYYAYAGSRCTVSAFDGRQLSMCCTGTVFNGTLSVCFTRET